LPLNYNFSPGLVSLTTLHVRAATVATLWPSSVTERTMLLKNNTGSSATRGQLNMEKRVIFWWGVEFACAP